MLFADASSVLYNEPGPGRGRHRKRHSHSGRQGGFEGVFAGQMVIGRHSVIVFGRHRQRGYAARPRVGYQYRWLRTRSWLLMPAKAISPPHVHDHHPDNPAVSSDSSPSDASMVRRITGNSMPCSSRACVCPGPCCSSLRTLTVITRPKHSIHSHHNKMMLSPCIAMRAI